ncbi:MAG: MBL fold metallo-hydrolase, partial [Gammaproteobacteria bacterium]
MRDRNCPLIISRWFSVLCLLLLTAPIPAGAAGGCPAQGIALQVLGSGGPELYPDRAATGYLLWLEGRARLLIDSGGGVMRNFARAGARIEDLDALLFTHLHVDHSADLPVLVKASFFGERTRSLPLYGPEGNPAMPSMTAFTVGLFGPRGIYHYLSDFLLGNAAGYQLEPHDVPLE